MDGERIKLNEIIVPAAVEKYDEINDRVSDFLRENGCPENIIIRIAISIEEIFVNIAHYSYPTDRGGMAHIFYWLADGNFSIRFEDEGIPYDPLKKPDPDITLTADERSVGGLGIYMVKKNMDDVLYSYENGKNKLTLVKKIVKP